MIRWLTNHEVRFLHTQVIQDFGGAHGTRDEGLFESALQRPLNLHAYKSEEDIARLASSYAFGLARNHPFLDGNKRVAFAAAFAFIHLNHSVLAASQDEAAAIMLEVATGSITEEYFADWLRRHMT